MPWEGQQMKFKAWVAELIGTFALTFIGVGTIANLAGLEPDILAQYGDLAAVGNAVVGKLGLVGIALAHGLTIAVMVSATAAISGGHLNPAVTIGLWSAGKIDGANALGYIVSQVIGSLAATGLLALTLGDRIRAVQYGSPMLGEGVSIGTGLTVEAVLTFFLVFVIYGTAVDKRAPKMAGLFIGLTVTLDILIGGPVTGAAMNPARQFAPALYAGGVAASQIWLYWLGPVLGAVLAAQVWRNFLEEK
jgi:aquaporin TIP